jgi:predicted permease
LADVFASRPGLNPDGLSLVSFSTTLGGYENADGLRFQRRALEAVAALPGVMSVTLAKSVPLGTDHSNTFVFPENAAMPRRLEQGWPTAYYNVSPGYFRTMETRLRGGREFGWRESQSMPVAIVNETFARKMFGTTNAVGRHFRYYGGDPVEVIAVAEDGKYFTLAEEPRPVVFRPITRYPEPEATLVVRSARPEGQMAAEMARAIRGLDPAMPLYAVGSMRDGMGLSYLPAEIALTALGTFGILAVMLAVTGIYGMASYSVSRRVREIGVRMAIGARPVQVLRTVLGRLAIVVACGCVAGLALGLASGKLLSAVVYQASPRDPLTLALVCGVMAMVALGSSWGPLRRAITIEPVRALREE